MTIKYAKIIDEETKMCDVGIGTDIDYYKSIKFTELDAEQSYNSNWYLVGYVPQKPLEEQLQEKKQEKIQELKLNRNDYLINNETNNDYNLSENDKFNIINLIGYTELEKLEYLNFVGELKIKYDNYKEAINKAESIEELNEIIIEFKEEEI